MLAEFGYGILLVSFLVTVYSLIAAVYGVMDTSVALVESSRRGMLLVFPLLSLSAASASSLPFVHPQMHVVITFEADRADADRDHRVAVELIDADGARLLSLEGGLRFGSPPPGEQVRDNHVLQLNNLKFERFGAYDFKMLVNNEVRNSFPLTVAEAPKAHPQ